MSKQIQYKPTRIDWIGDIPNHWELNRLKIGITLIKNGVWGEEPKEDDNDIYCVRVADFNRTNMSINDSNLTSRSIELKDRELRILEYGDLLIERSGGGERQPVGFVVRFTGDYRAVFTNFMSRLKVSSISDSNFLKYVFKAMYDARLNVRSLKQTTGIQNLDLESYLNEIVPYPPVNEQETISNFLDKETAKINNLIEKKQRLIELLQEKRQALITNAVTKGLDPNVPMKDSGIPWLGEVPEHWKVKKLKYWVEFLNHRRIPLSSDERHDLEKVYPYYGASGIIDYVDRYLFNEDSILIAEDGANLYSRSSRLAFIAKGKYWVNNHAHILKPIAGDLMYWSERLESIKYDPFITGSAQPKLSLENLASIEFAAPDNPVEQVQIGKYINKVNTTYDILISKIQTQLTKLKEYRQALITSAVTGKIDVREKVSS